jgi:hypothetical protein
MRSSQLRGRGPSAAALALAILLAAPARTDSYALLRAHVVDEEGRPLERTVLRISPPGFTATSDAQGFVRIRVKAQAYELRASRNGYETDVLSGVELPAGGVRDVVLVLRRKGPSGTGAAAAAP